MAEAPVNFDQSKFFQQSDPLLNATLTNVATFSGDVSAGLGQLLEFLNLTKFYLNTIADPISLVLIPAIDQLIKAIEDLKNIGFGTLTVWPWESGNIESGIDTAKTQEALKALITSLNDINPEKLRWNAKENQFESLVNLGDADELKQLTGMNFNFGSYSNITIEDGDVIQQKSLDKSWINDTLNTVYNYINPKEWEEGDDAAKRIINSLNESFKIRTLTPSQFISEIGSSFDDTNDPARPVGSGPYIAFVCFFALPTHHALRDMINSLLKFFANFLENLPDLEDDKVFDIELGHPLVISGLERELHIATGKAKIDADAELIEVANEISDAQDAEAEAGVLLLYGSNAEKIKKYKSILKKSRERYTNALSEVGYYSTQISDLRQQLLTSPDTISIEQEIARLSDLATKASENVRFELIAQQEYGRHLANATAEANNLQTNFNDKVEKVKQIEAKQNAIQKRRDSISLDTTKLKEKFYMLDDTSKRDLSSLTGEDEVYTFTPDRNGIGRATNTPITIPMFMPEQIIQQGHVFNDYTAEVVSHTEIKVKDGHVISNKLKVRKQRGSIKPNTASPNQQINVPPIIALDGKQLDSFGILKTGEGIQGAKDALNFTMFAPANPDVPQLEPGIKFKATMTSGDPVLRSVLPVNKIIRYNSQGRTDDPLDVLDIYNDRKLINDTTFQALMESFIEGLSIGSPIAHNFLTTSEISKEDIPVNPFNRLGWSLFPGMGVTPCIKSVKINNKELQKQDIKTQLFKKVKKDPSDKIVEYESMHEITIGRVTKDGPIESYPVGNIKVPNGFVNNNFLEVPLTLYKTQGSRSSLPNWKFTRIQDLFPIYGTVIDRIVDKLEYAKDLASGSLDDLNKWIQYFEDLVRDLKQLNEEIQKLLVFLSSGLDKAGLYSASFSGNDGVQGFKRKLNSAQVKNVNLEPVKEFSLEPVKITRQRQNPVTGEQETIETEVLKMISKENPESVGEKLIPISDLDSLKYSGGFVFYAQGNDGRLLEKFLLTSGLKPREEKEFPTPAVTGDVDFDLVNSLLEFVKPRVGSIGVEQTGFLNDNYFIDAEGAEVVRKNTQIKINFVNDVSELSFDQRKQITDARGDDFNFNVDVNYGSIIPSANIDSGNVLLSSDNFETVVPLSYSVQPVTEEVPVIGNETETVEVINSVIIKPQNRLESLTNYKIKVLGTVMNTSNLTLKDNFEMQFGFKTAATSIIDIGLE